MAEKYGVALFVVGVAFALRYGLYGDFGNRIPFGFFTLATLISAWYGGLGPGLLAALGGLVLADYFFLPPHTAEGLGETERTAVGVYAMTNTLIVVLFWHLHTRLRAAEDALRKLEGPSEDEAGRTQPHSDASGQVHPL